MRIAVFLPFFSSWAASSMAPSATDAGSISGSGGAARSASSQAVSAGRMRVAIWPGAVRAACTARAPSAAIVLALMLVCTQAETGRAKPVMSEASGASYCGVIGGVIADDIDDRRGGAARVVQIGQPVGEAGPEMQQRRRRLLLHAAIAVGHAGHRAFEQAQDRAHAPDLVERGDEMHFRGPGIGEADFDARGDERCDKAFGAVHVRTLISFFNRREVPARRAKGQSPERKLLCETD